MASLNLMTWESSVPLLRNIFKEVADDIHGGAPAQRSTDLSDWARQGVLLLNASLTVEAGAAGSHRDLGWLALTDDIIAQLSAKRDGTRSPSGR